MENSDDKIKEARFGTVSSTKGARDTAADVVFYDAEDSGLTFTKKRYKRIYDRAKKRYTKKKLEQQKEQEILNNPKEHFNEYIALKRDKTLKESLPFFAALNPWTIGALATSAAVSVPSTLTGLTTGTIGSTIGSSYGSKLDTNRHGYTNNADWYGFGAGLVAGGAGSTAGAAGEKFVLNKGYNWVTHNIKNLGRGFSDYSKYGVKQPKTVVYNNGLKYTDPSKLPVVQNIPKQQTVQLTDNVTGILTKAPGEDVQVVRAVVNNTNLGRFSINPYGNNVDFNITAPNKSAAKWIYKTISDLVKPGDYIGNDNTTSTLGNRLRISKTISNNPIEFVKTMSELSKIENQPTQYGYSPDSYAQILKIGNNSNKPYKVRYAISPSDKFNDMGKSPLSAEITYKQDWELYTPELIRQYVDLVNNKLIKPNGGDPGWIGLNGKPKFPHPYLMRK